MLNRALRLLEAEVIVKIGFFIHDLHEQIQQLHQEQIGKCGAEPFLVYRGHGLFSTDFEKLKKCQGGLISFNCFLSTSMKQETSIEFARVTPIRKGKVGILFVMTINPKIASILFANIRNVSYSVNEPDILLSMPTVFRIDTIKRKDRGETVLRSGLKLDQRR